MTEQEMTEEEIFADEEKTATERTLKESLFDAFLLSLCHHFYNEWILMLAYLYAAEHNLLTENDSKELINYILNHPYKRWASEKGFFRILKHIDFEKFEADEILQSPEFQKAFTKHITKVTPKTEHSDEDD